MATIALTYCSLALGLTIDIDYNDVTHAIDAYDPAGSVCSTNQKVPGQSIYSHVDGDFSYSVLVKDTAPYAYVKQINNVVHVPEVCTLLFYQPGCFSQNASEDGVPDGIIFVSTIDENSLEPVRYSLNSDFTYPFGQSSNQFIGLLPGTYTVYARNSSTCLAEITIIVGADRSYGIKYRLPFEDPYNNQYKLEIEDSEYTGSVNDIVGGSMPVKIIHRGEEEENIFYSVIASLIEVTIISQTDQQYIEFYTFDERRFRAKVYKWNGSSYDLYHFGYLTPMLYSEPYVLKEGYEVSLTFTDGLADLVNYEFSDDSDNFPEGRIPIFNALNYIINKTNIALDYWESVNVYASIMLSGTDDSTLEQGYLDPKAYLNSDGTVKNCREVLGYIMDFLGSRIYQANGRWNIDLVSEKTASAVPTRKRTSNYGVITGGNENPRVLLRRSVAASPRVMWKDQSQVMSIPHTWGTIKLTHNLGTEARNNLLPYGEFFEADIENGQFKGWQIDDANGGGATFGLEKIERNGAMQDVLFVDFSACPIADNYVILRSIFVPYDYPGAFSYQWIKVSFDIYTRPLFEKAEIFLDYAVILNNGLFVTPRIYPDGTQYGGGKRIISSFTDELIEDRYNRLSITDSLSWKTISFEFPIYFSSLNTISSDGDLQVEFKIRSNKIYDYIDITTLKTEVVSLASTQDTIYWNKIRRVKDTLSGVDVIRIYKLERGGDAESLPEIVRPNGWGAGNTYYIWKQTDVVEITATDKNWLQNILIDNIKLEYLPDGETPVETELITEVPNLKVRQTLEKTLFHGDMTTKSSKVWSGALTEFTDYNYKNIQRSYISLDDGTPITGGWKRRGVTENYTVTQLLAKMMRGQYQELRWKQTGTMICPDGMLSFWNTVHEVRTGKIYELISLVQNLKFAEAEVEMIETLSGGTPLDESTDPGGDPGDIEPPVETRVHSIDFSSDFN